jgi:tRNA threonylcarbamoyladenosine biosynthesis protein TsaB
MNVLAFDTCFAACSVATRVGADERVSTSYEPMQVGHAERLVSMVGEVMAHARLTWKDIDLIGVTNGPGSFVGTRVGVSAARAFALVTGVPVIAVSSLEVMARGASRLLGTLDEICVVVDMRRDEVYTQSFDATLHPTADPQLLPIAVAASTSRGAVTFVGTGARMVGELYGVDRCRMALPDLLPDARDIVGIVTSQRYASSKIEPIYLRPPDAKPPTAAPLGRR